MKRKIFRVFSFTAGSFFLFIFLLNSHMRNSEEDKQCIQMVLRDWHMQNELGSVQSSFENQIAFIQKLQDSTIFEFSNGDVDPSNSMNMEYLYSHRRGLCFNRSFFQEKVLRYAGFDTRHLYVYFTNTEAKTVMGDLFHKKLYSHAMFEVKTKKGWMAVETNSNWLALDKDNNPMTLGEVKKRLMENRLELAKYPTKGDIFFTDLPVSYNFKFLYGVYSRHGNYLESGPVENLFKKSMMFGSIPDYDLSEIVCNF